MGFAGDFLPGEFGGLGLGGFFGAGHGRRRERGSEMRLDLPKWGERESLEGCGGG